MGGVCILRVMERVATPTVTVPLSAGCAGKSQVKRAKGVFYSYAPYFHRMYRLFVTAALGAALVLPTAAHASSDQVLGGWFGNWHPPQVVEEKMQAGAGVLTDSAVFSWSFAGVQNPVCAMTQKSVCQDPGKISTQDLRRAIAGMAGTTVWVSHIDLNYSRARELAALLKNRRQRNDLINVLVDRTVRVGADGLDLDWENFAFNDGSSTWASTRKPLNKTVRRLAKRLHAQGKLLSVTVPVGSSPLTASGRPRLGGGYSVFDWKRLAAKADRLNLMAYDYSFSAPGPIGPHYWAKQAVTAATRAVGAENAKKVIIGVPLYGKSWPTPGRGGQAVVGQCPSSWKPKSIKSTFSVTALQAPELAEENGAKISYSAKSGESTFKYSEKVPGSYSKRVGPAGKRRTVKKAQECEVSRTVWFGSRRTVIKRAKLARRAGIGGVFAWNLAATDEALFEKYREKWGDSLPSQ